MGDMWKRRPFFPLLLGMTVVIGMLPVIPIKAQGDKLPGIVGEPVETAGEDKEKFPLLEDEESIIKGETTGEAESAKPDEEEKTPELPEQVPSEPKEHQHDAHCGYVEAQPEIACDHTCKEVDKDKKLIHCKECAYRPEIIASPCKWEIKEEEKEPTVEEKEDSDKSEKDNENLDSENKTNPPKEEGGDAEESTAEETPDVERVPEPEENEAAFLVRIPSQVFISETSQSFDVETEKVGQLPEGEVVITVEGTASEETGNFALYREGDPDKCYEYQLQMGEQILTGKQNKMVIDQDLPGQSMTVIPMNQSWELPAGNYQGTLTFRVSYEPTEQQ